MFWTYKKDDFFFLEGDKLCSKLLSHLFRLSAATSFSLEVKVSPLFTLSRLTCILPAFAFQEVLTVQQRITQKCKRVVASRTVLVLFFLWDCIRHIFVQKINQDWTYLIRIPFLVQSKVQRQRNTSFIFLQILVEHFPQFQEIFRCGNLLSYGLHIMNT